MLAGNGGRDSLSLVELLQFDDGVFDTRNGKFTENAVATPKVEALVTSPGFSTDPEAPSAPSAISTAQIEPPSLLSSAISTAQIESPSLLSSAISTNQIEPLLATTDLAA